MNIVSLLPSVTEILCELGLEDHIVGISHECDFPETIRSKEVVGFSSIDSKNLNSLEIDELVRRNIQAGKSSYFLKIEKIEEIKPDYIITQDLCEVCALSEDAIVTSLSSLTKKPKIITVGPKNIEDIKESIRKIAKEFKIEEKGLEIINNFNSEINSILSKTEIIIDRPRVFCMEWMNPFYSAGHWVPEMVEIAGGISGLSKSGEPSHVVQFDEIIKYAPNYIFIMPCGYAIDDSLKEINLLLENTKLNEIPAFKTGDVYLVDANSFFTRPSTRVAGGIKLLARTINSESFEYEPTPDSILNLQNYIHFESFVG